MLSCSVVCKQLSEMGVTCEPKNIDLDGGKRWGILCETGDALGQLIVPVDDVLEFALSVEDAAEYIKDYVDESKLPDCVNYETYINREFILENVKLTLGERHWCPYFIRNSKLPGIIESCYIGDVYRNDMFWIIDVTSAMLEKAGITEQEMWEHAEQNTYQRKRFHTRSVFAMFEARGIKVRNENNPVKFVYLITGDNSGIKGAVQVQNYEFLKQFIREQFITSEIVVYPQSENGFLVAPYNTATLDTVKAIAENDNEGQWLSDFIYIVDLKDRFTVSKSIKLGRE